MYNLALSLISRRILGKLFHILDPWVLLLYLGGGRRQYSRLTKYQITHQVDAGTEEPIIILYTFIAQVGL